MDMTEATEHIHATVPDMLMPWGFSSDQNRQAKPDPTTLRSTRAQTRASVTGGGHGVRGEGLFRMERSGSGVLTR